MKGGGFITQPPIQRVKIKTKNDLVTSNSYHNSEVNLKNNEKFEIKLFSENKKLIKFFFLLKKLKTHPREHNSIGIPFD